MKITDDEFTARMRSKVCRDIDESFPAVCEEVQDDMNKLVSRIYDKLLPITPTEHDAEMLLMGIMIAPSVDYCVKKGADEELWLDMCHRVWQAVKFDLSPAEMRGEARKM